MKNKFIYAFVIFSFGYIANDIVGNFIRPAYAYSMSSYDIMDFTSRVEDIIDSHSFYSSDISDFESEVESIVESCTADDYGISC